MRSRPDERISVVFTCCSHPEEQSTSTGDRMEAHKTHTESHSAAPASSGTAGRSWWDTDNQMKQTKRQPGSAPPRWRFSSISFPDLGSKEAPGGCLPPPDPSLLPGPFSVGGCEINPWRQRINLREVKMSERDRKRDKDKRRFRRDINRDREVCGMSSKLRNFNVFIEYFYMFGVYLKVQRCRNWAEYRELLERRKRRPRGGHKGLWNREVAPLHDPRHPIPTGELT